MVDTEQSIAIETRDGIRYVEPQDVIHFPEGLPGFETYADYAVFDITDCHPFKSMLSVEKNGPDFIVVDPAEVFTNYAPLSILNIPDVAMPGNPMELAVLTIVTLTENPKEATVNLRGPILIDLKTRDAHQAVLPDESYSTREPLGLG